MYRLTVALLAAFDAALAVAVGLAATLAPLTVLFVFGLGAGADWSALWPVAATVWQFGNLVPLAVTLPGEYLAVTGISPDAASFTLSLAPLAFAAFLVVFAARSGVRASRAEAWITGVVTGSIVAAGLATAVALTAHVDIADAKTWQAILFPALLYAVPALIAAVVTEWVEAGGGVVAGLRDRVDALPHGWGAVPGLAVRGGAIAVTGLIGIGALVFAAAVLGRAGHIVALYEAAHVDAAGAVVLTLGQLAYLPTFVVWGLSFAAGPGFALGTDSAVSPAGTQVGVLPGIPALGAVPESTTTWLLLLALLPVAAGAFAGWVARSRLAAARPLATEAAAEPLPAADAADREVWPRLVIAAGIAALAGAAAAVLAALGSGGIGPGVLGELGPQPGPLALVVGVEVLIGAGILLLSPRGAVHAAAPVAADARADQAPEVAPVD